MKLTISKTSILTNDIALLENGTMITKEFRGIILSIDNAVREFSYTSEDDEYSFSVRIGNEKLHYSLKDIYRDYTTTELAEKLSSIRDEIKKTAESKRAESSILLDW